MKITHIETFPVQVPINPQRAIRGGRGMHTTSPFLMLKVYTDEGIHGVGEVSCTPGWSGEDNITAAHFIRQFLEPALVDEDPTQIERLTTKMRTSLANNPFTRSGIEMALWDILGKVAGLPVYRLLGGAVREFVPTKFSVSGLEPPQAAAIAAWAVEQGFRTMKVKVGIEPEQDVARVPRRARSDWTPCAFGGGRQRRLVAPRCHSDDSPPLCVQYLLCRAARSGSGCSLVGRCARQYSNPGHGR